MNPLRTLANWFSNSQCRPAVRRPRAFRPAIEALEERQLLSSTPLAPGSEPIPILHSNLGAERTLWLDFDGLNGEAKDWGWIGPAKEAASGIGGIVGGILTGGLLGAFYGEVIGGLIAGEALPEPSTPRFDTDGVVNSFSAGEAAAMHEIWARVSEDFAPFNIDVTTERPADFGNGRSRRVSIGGDASWIPFDSPPGIGLPEQLGLPTYDTVFVFSQHPDFKNRVGVITDIAGIADTASHEAGHGFGLYHQSEFVGDCECTPQQEGDGELKDEYIDVWAEGSTVTPANHTPLMGGVQGERSTWWVGPRHLQSIPELGDNTFEDIAAIAGSAGELISQSSTIVWQDDMEVLANELGYRPDNDGGALIFVDSLDEDDRPFFAPVESVYEATGIIGRMGDTDVFTVETQGRATLRIRTPRLGRNLDPDVVLRDSYGNVVDNKGDMIFRPQENQDDWVMATAANGYSLEIPRAGIWQLLVRAHLPTDEQLDDDCNEGYLTHGNVGQYQLTVEEISNPGVIDSWITRNGNYYNEPMNIHLRFDRPMNPASFTAAQIELRNGDGAVLRVRNRELHVQPGTGNTEFYIQRGAVPLHGYSLLLRSGISDPFGNLLDQDGNPANGLAGYRTSFSDTRKPELASAQAYDGFIRLNFSEGIDASSLPASRILSLTNAGGTPLTVVGAPRPVAGTDYRSWDISIAQTPTRGFAVRLGSAVQDMWGNTIESTRRRLTVNDTVGPRVRELYVADNTTPMPGTMATQYLVVTFNERIAAASFSVSSLSTLDPDVVVRGPGGMLVPVISIGPGPGAEQQSFLVAVAPPPGLAGSYTVTIGPDIRDVYGNRMDQDADGRIGLNLRDRGRGLSIWRPEAAQDSYTSAPFRFGDMPVSAGPRDLETWFRFIMSGDVRLPQLVEPGAPPIDPLDPVIMERYFNEVLEAGRYGFTLSDELLTDLADLRIRGAIDPSRLP